MASLNQKENNISNKDKMVENSQVSTQGDFRIGDNNDSSIKTEYHYHGSSTLAFNLLVLTGISIIVLAVFLLKDTIPTNELAPASELEDQRTTTPYKATENEPSPEISLPAVKPSATPVSKAKKTKENKLIESDYFDPSLQVSVALYGVMQLDNMELLARLKTHLISEETTFSGQYLSPKFNEIATADLRNADFTTTRQILKASATKCICQIREDISLSSTEIEGYQVWTARGTAYLDIYHRATGLTTLAIDAPAKPARSSGVAIQDVRKALINSPDWKKIDFTNCK